MIGPGFTASRESTPGLWTATTGFGVEINGIRGLLTLATAVVFTRKSPLPDATSRCKIGSVQNLAFDRHLSPQTLIGPPLKHDFVPIIVPDTDLDAGLPGASGALQPGDAESNLPRAIKVAVWRNSTVTPLDGILSKLQSPITRNRVVQPPGGIVAVTYTSTLQVELTDPQSKFAADDAGAPIYALATDGAPEALGVLLWPYHQQRGLLTNIQRILSILPLNGNLI